MRRGSVVAIFVLAAAIRVLYLLSIRDAYFFHRLQTEPLRYYGWAVAIADARGAPTPPFDEAPGYPYFLAGIFRTFGRPPLAIALVQAGLDALACALVAGVAQRWFGSAVGIVAGTIAATYGPLVYFTGAIEPAIPFVCALTAAFAATGGGRWLLGGCLWAVAFLFRTEAVLGVPFAVLDAGRRGGRAAVARTLVPLVVLVVALASVNVAHTGRLVLYI